MSECRACYARPKSHALLLSLGTGKRRARCARSPHVTDLLYSCPQPDKKSKKGKEESKKQKEKQKEKEQTKKKKEEGKKKKMSGQAPKKKKEEAADEGDEGEEEEDEEDPEIVLLGTRRDTA